MGTDIKKIEFFLSKANSKLFKLGQPVYITETRNLLYRVVYQLRGNGIWLNRLIRQNSDIVGEVKVKALNKDLFNKIYVCTINSGILVNEKI